MADYKSAYTGAQIDDAVSKAHQHNNKTILDNITAPYTTEEKTKLAGLNNYTLPVASSTVLGGVKAGENVTVTEDGTLNVTGAVDSVNGKTGTVVINASDVGALPDTTTIPTKTSDLQNDSGYITGYTESDPTVPTHVKNITEENISTWNNKSDFSGNYEDLNNKPTIPTNNNELTNGAGYQTSSDVQTAINNALSGIIETEVDLSGYVQSSELIEITNDEIDQIWNS